MLQTLHLFAYLSHSNKIIRNYAKWNRKRGRNPITILGLRKGCNFGFWIQLTYKSINVFSRQTKDRHNWFQVRIIRRTMIIAMLSVKKSVKTGKSVGKKRCDQRADARISERLPTQLFSIDQNPKQATKNGRSQHHDASVSLLHSSHHVHNWSYSSLEKGSMVGFFTKILIGTPKLHFLLLKKQ